MIWGLYLNLQIIKTLGQLGKSEYELSDNIFSMLNFLELVMVL